MKKIIYVTLKDLAEYNKIDKDLLTDFLLEKNFLEKKNMILTPSKKGEGAGIHIANGKYGKFLLFNRNMDLYGLTKYRKASIDPKKVIGNNYEIFIGKYFEDKNYLVKYNGIENGVKDNSIDLIAINKKEVLLIQCKNWSKSWVEKNNKYINQKDLKSFIGDTINYVDKNPVLKDFIIKRYFIVSSPILSKDGFAYMKNEKNFFLKIIPFKI
jgi:hypothetical protein